MLERPGDLIPVLPNATSIPWTRRRSQILNFLHRGPVTFQTLVYDTNVGDISALATYFNPDRISERELNLRFGHYPTSGEKHASPQKTGNEPIVKPRLLLYPDHNLNSSQVKVQRTLNWVLSQDSDSGSGGTSGHSTPEPGLVVGHGHGGVTPEPGLGHGLQPPRTMEPAKADPENNLSLDTSQPPPVSKHFTVPTSTIHSALDSVWTDNKQGEVETGLGLGQLATRVSKSNEMLDTLERLEGGERWWGAWDTSQSW